MGMKIMETVSWFPLMLLPPTLPSTAYVCRVYWRGCRRSRPDSIYSCWTCAGKGEQNNSDVMFVMVSSNSCMFLMQKPQWWHHCFTRTNKGDSKHSVWICHVSIGLIWFHLDVQCWCIAPCFRCVDAEAYEVKREDVTNGIFISFLKRRVCEDEKVTVMLDRVAEGMWRTQLMWQMDVYLR